jgi:hypothetical protein
MLNNHLSRRYCGAALITAAGALALGACQSPGSETCPAPVERDVLLEELATILVDNGYNLLQWGRAIGDAEKALTQNDGDQNKVFTAREVTAARTQLGGSGNKRLADYIADAFRLAQPDYCKARR